MKKSDNVSSTKTITSKASNKNETLTMNVIKAEEILCEFDRNTSEQEIQGRAVSIKGVGLIHSIKIQPIEHANFKYKVVAGRKSFIAMTQILGKTEFTVPSEVSFIEGDAELIAFAENDERTNLTLAEQIEKLSGLSEKFGIAELATHLSHSPQWIAARIRLQALADCWKQAIKENRFPHFVIGHYETVAKYPEEVQRAVFDYFSSYNADSKIPLAQFDKYLEDNFTFLLKNAPWNKDGSYQGCGECLACIDRKNNGFLFDDMNDYSKARCQNRQFYLEKLHAFIAEKVEKIRQDEPETLLISQSREYPEGFPLDTEEVYPSHAWTQVSKKKGGQRAFIVCGPQAGNITHVKIEDYYQKQQEARANSLSGNEPETTEEKRPSTLSERKERKHRQRQRHCIDALIAYLEKFEYQIPDRNTIFKLIACLGVDSVFSGNWGKDTPKEGIASYPLVDEESLDAEVWKKLTCNLVNELKQCQSGSVEAKWIEAETLSPIVGFDLEKAFTEAVEELPDPKAWQELEKKEQQLAEQETTAA
ncbi:MAG: hypothetical protein WC071_13760 [Victivallaceae bacterium]